MHDLSQVSPQDHLEHCSFIAINCALCGEQVLACSLAEHRKRCPAMPVVCRLCGASLIQREIVASIRSHCWLTYRPCAARCSCHALSVCKGSREQRWILRYMHSAKQIMLNLDFPIDNTCCNSSVPCSWKPI